MANIFQRIFYEDYQCVILDMINDYDVHHRHDEWDNMYDESIHCEEDSYSVRDKKIFVIATRSCKTKNTPVFRLYMEDNRPASPIPYQAAQLNTRFAEKIYYKMKSKYQDTHNVR